MSAAVVNGLVLLVTALLLMVIVHAWAWPPDRWLYIQPEAERALRDRAEQFRNELREAAAGSPRAVKQGEIVKRDVKAEYYRRRKLPGKTGYFLEILRKAVGGITFGVVGFVAAVLALPFLAKPFPVVAGTAGYAGPPLAALAMVVAATKFLNPRDVRGDSLHVSVSQQSSGSAPDPYGEGNDPVAKALDRYRERVTRATRNHALSTAARKRSRREGISEEELESAWRDLVIPYPATLAPSGIRSRKWIVSVVVAALIVAVPIYLIFVRAIPKLALSVPWRLVAVAASLLILYGLMRAIVGAWRRHEAEPGGLARAASAMVNRAWMILARFRKKKDTSMPHDPPAPSGTPDPAPASPDPSAPSGTPDPAPASPDPPAPSGRRRPPSLAKGAVTSANNEQSVKSAQEAGRSGKPRKRFSDRWMLGRQLADLDNWPSTDENLGEPTIDPALYRLNWSIKWHTLAHLQAKRWYTGIKIFEIVAAAAIPVLAATGGNSFETRGWVAGLGALVVVLEGIQQLKKYAQNALLWGQGKEALKREYYLYEARVSPYNSADRETRLASRIEQIIGQEVTQWAARNEEKSGNGAPRASIQKPVS